MIPIPPPETESEVRKLRDAVYGAPSKDLNWDGCKDAWMIPENIRWLKEKSGGEK